MAIIKGKDNGMKCWYPSELYGLSTDTKPTTGIDPTSTFYEWDTGNSYIFDGTQWWAV